MTYSLYYFLCLIKALLYIYRLKLPCITIISNIAVFNEPHYCPSEIGLKDTCLYEFPVKGSDETRMFRIGLAFGFEKSLNRMKCGIVCSGCCTFYISIPECRFCCR